MTAAARARLFAILALSLWVGCGSDEPGGARDPRTAAAAPGFHTRYGFPGPWTRKGATPEEFDTHSATCLERSNEARRAPGDGNRHAAAYRAFLDCMGSKGWARGVGPRPRHVSDAPASRTPAPFN